ncbi:DNA topoisomerase IB [Prosthecobacter sp.]|uniref:DNA topoisomerase IB n=1 Tax=Prosthecobacter sp. TaxID=1965333 RepID=UPI0037836848
MKAGTAPPVSVPPDKTARQAGLRYVLDEGPGITRRRRGRAFVYHLPGGKLLRDQDALRRIRSLAIPPAWTEVWICPIENGHIQATGRDARRRKQYRYHPRWLEARDATKYERVQAFGAVLSRIRRRVDADLRRHGLSREKVMATIVRLLETTLIRVGNDEYAQQNGSYGLTTMHNRHAKVRGAQITFSFKGKSGKHHQIDMRDPRLAKLVRRCQELPGQNLFGYLDEEGVVHQVASEDVNAYLREIAGEEFSAKDFRTWAGTVLAAVALRSFGPFHSLREAKRNVGSAVAAVAKMLGNTPAVCRRSYIHPVILDSYLAGEELCPRRSSGLRALRGSSLGRLRSEEAEVLLLLRERASSTAPVPAAVRRPSRRRQC